MMMFPSLEAVPLDPHVTILVLPSGVVHVATAVLDGPGDRFGRLREAWGVPQDEAARLGRQVRVSVARPEGRVEALLVDADGLMVAVDRHPRPLPAGGVDPRWSDGMPEWSGLLDVVRAAERGGQWEDAQAAAERLEAHVRGQLGDEHPHTVLAVELQGFFALHAGDWVAAARLHLRAAVGRFRLGSPESEITRVVRNAVACWQRSRREGNSFETGCELAHVLTRVAPDRPGRLGGVLRRLEQR